MTAASINAMSINIHDFDDTHLRTVIHPTAPIAPVLWALASRQRVNGADLRHAFALGVEVACRIGNAVSPGHYARGWHITGTCGIFGAAAAAARVLGLDAPHTAHALGIAATQASGLVDALGSMAKVINSGNAARNGLYAALLAQQGFTGSTHALEAEQGFMNCFGGDHNVHDTDLLVTGLGEHWELLANAYKPYPTGVVFQPIIDACLTLRARPGFAAESIRSISVHSHPLVRQRGDRLTPTTGLAAKLSMQYCAAVALQRGHVGLGDFADQQVNWPDTHALQQRVSIVDDARIGKQQSRVVLILADGSIHEAFIEHALGSLGRPMSDDALGKKFMDLAYYSGMSRAISVPLLDRLWTLEHCPDAQSVLALTAG